MKKLILLSFFVLCMVNYSLSKPVGQERAQRVAEHFARSHGFYGNANATVKVTDLTPATSFTELYVFSIARSDGSEGFVIVSGDDIARPVLGYSSKNRFVTEEMPEHVRSWFEGYEQEIRSAREQGVPQNSFIGSQWSMLENGQDFFDDADVIVSPLVQTQWNQGSYYNDLCPQNASGTRAVTGCVATAMAQIMKYWDHPLRGTGSHSYTSSRYGTLTVDFGGADYHWANMPISLNASSTPQQVEAVATLMYHCGVAVNMNYGPSESSAYSHGSDPSAEAAFKTYFNYAPSLYGAMKSSYADTVWKRMLITELNEMRPLFYRGEGGYGGHAFILDGYDIDTLFHINWGWGGGNDGYYSLSALIPDPYYSLDYSFTSYQGALFGVKPVEYPYGVFASNIDTNSVDLSWGHFNPPSTLSYIIAYGLASTFNINNSATYTTLTSPVNQITITGLTQLTDYRVMVRAVMGTDTSGWTPQYTFTTLPTCPKPVSLRQVGATNSSVTVSWSPGGSETSWIVSNGINSVYTTDTSHTFTDLDANTRYDINVKGICRVGVTSVAATTYARTTCDTIGHSELPYAEGFEDWNTSSSSSRLGNPCWTRTTNYPSLYYPNVTSSTAHSGNKSLNMFIPSGSYWGYISLPRFEDSISNLVVRCYIKNSNAGSPSYGIQIGVTTDLDDENTFRSIATLYPSMNEVWEEKEVVLSSYTGDDGFITFRVPTSYSSNGPYIDDIKIFTIPSCWRPTTLEVLSHSSSSLKVSWIPDSRSTGTYILEYGPAGFAQGTGTVLITSDTAVEIVGLASFSYYDVYVRTICQAGDTSEARMASGHTRCSDISHSELPYYYGFEDATSTSTTGLINPCWSKNVVKSKSSYPYPAPYAHSGSRGLLFYGYYDSTRCWAVMPTFEDSLSDLKLSFWLRGYRTDYPYNSTITVGVMNDPNDIETFSAIGTYTATSTVFWDSFTVYLGTYTGYGRYIAFLADDNNDTRPNTYVYLDDVKVDLAPTCGPVSNLAVTPSAYAAMITWQPCVIGNTPQHFTIEYRQSGASSWTTAGITTDTYFALTNLNLNTGYEVRVAANCGEENSAWEYAGFFTEVCLSATDFTIGSNNSSSSGVPVYSSYGNTMCQSIYTADELTSMGLTAGTVSQLCYTWTANNSYAKTFTIFMGKTSVSSYANTSVNDFVPFSSQTLVYTGSHPLNTSGTVTYTLSTPFVWDGTSNIVITTFMNQPVGYSHTSSEFNGISSNCGDYRTLYSYKDRSAYTTSNYTTYTRLERTTYRPNITLIICDSTATCAHPAAVVNNITSSSAQIVWTPGNNESAWNIYYRRSGQADYTIADTNVTTTSYTISNLLPNRTYCFKVEAICSEENNSVEVTATTLYGPVQLPFVCDFEEEDDNGWTLLNGMEVNKWFVGKTTSSSGKRSMYVSYAPGGESMNYNKNQVASVFAFQMVSIPTAGDYRYSYDWKGYGEWVYDYLNVALVPEDIPLKAGSTCGFSSTAVPPGAIRLFPSGQMNEKTSWVSVSDSVTVSTPGNYNLVVFWHNQYSSGSNPPGCIDNISLSYISCHTPANLTVTDVTTNSFTVSWTSDDDASAWLVSNNIDTFTTTSTTYTFTGLEEQTQYNISVRSLCGLDDTGYAVTTIGYTSCYPVTHAELPYYESFETWSTGSAFGTLTKWPDDFCWSYASKYPSSTSHYPYVVDSKAHTGTQSLYMTKPGSSWADISMPRFEDPVSSLVARCYIQNNYSAYTIQVGVKTDLDDENSFIPVATLIPTPTWQEKEIEFSSYTGVEGYITFRVPYTEYSSTGIYIDDITVMSAPSCWRPVSVSSSSRNTYSLDVSWTPDPRSSERFLIEYGPVGFVPGTGDTVSTTDTLITLTGFAPDSYYDVYVCAVCGADDKSESRKVTGHTRCTYISHDELPYTYGFEDASAGSNAAINFCWRKGTDGLSTQDPYTTTSARSGNWCLYFSNSNSARSWVVTPAFEDDISDLQISFGIRSGSTSYSKSVTIGVMVDPDDISTFTPVGTYTTGPRTDNWDSTTFYMNNYQGDGHYIAFLAEHNEYFSLDDIEINITPSCAPVSNLLVDASAYSAFVTWEPCTAGNTSLNYTVSYREEGTTQWITAGTTTNHYYPLTGLTLNTQYEVCVVSNCIGESSACNYRSFSTKRCAVQDGFTFGTGSSNSSGVPVYSSYGNTMCQSIYTADELTALGLSAGPISQLQYTWTSNSSYAKTFTIYMGNTNVSSYSSSSSNNYVPFTNQTLVYSGSHPLNTSGTVSYTLSNPFVWDGTSNIVVTTFMNQPEDSYHNYSSFYGYSTYYYDTYRTLYSYKNETAYSTTNYTKYSGIRRSEYRPNITFIIDCPDSVDCIAPNPYFLDVSATSIDIIWTPGRNETSWNLYYKRSDQSDYTAVANAMTTNNYSFTGLRPNIKYDFKVEAVCSGENVSSIISTTTSPSPLPFICDFEEPDDNGWTLINDDYCPNKWWVGSATHNGGNRSMYISNSSDGSTLSYTNNSSTYAFATQLVSIPEAGRYVYRYDWKASGEKNRDYLNVALVPENIWLYSSSSCGFSYNGVPDGCVRLYPSGAMDLNPNWSTVTGVVTVPEPGIYKFVVYWRNNGSAGSNPPGAIDNIYLDRYTCPYPTNLTVTAVTHNSITVSWKERGDINGWLVSNGEQTVTVYSNSHTFTDLTPNTHYTISVRGVCDSGNNSMAVTTSVSTLCTSIFNLPYTDNFDSYTSSNSAKTGVEPPCWRLVKQDVNMDDDYKPMIYYSPDNAHSGDYSLILNKRGTYAMPAVATSVNALQLSFYLKQTAAKYQLQVGVMSNLCDTSSFVPVATIDNGSTTKYVHQTVHFTDYMGDGHHIVFRNILAPGNTGDYSCNYIDDVTLEVLPGGCGITVTDLPYTDNFDSYTTDTTAKTGIEPPCWMLAHQDVMMDDEYKPMIYCASANAHSGSYSLLLNKRCIYTLPRFEGDVNILKLQFFLKQTQAKYRLQVGVMTDLNDASTFVPVATLNNSSTSSSILQNVSFENYTGMGHYIAFRNILASGTGDYSCNYIDDLTLSVNTSSCTLSVDNLPYTDNFESYTSSTTAKTGIEPPCWTLAHQDVTMTNEYKPMVYYNSSNAHSGNYSLIHNKRGIYTMPYIDMDVKHLKLQFYLKQTQAKYQLQVGVMTDLNDSSTFVVVNTFNNTSTSSHVLRTVNFSSYTGTGRYIAFRNILDTENTGDYSVNYIDDITLSIATSYTITATANPSAGGTVSGQGKYAHGTICTLLATPNPNYFFTNWTSGNTVLSPDPVYTFTVSANRTIKANFTHVAECDITYADLPYTDDFDHYTTSTNAKTGIEPPCWTLAHQYVTMTDEYKPMIYFDSSNAHSGSYCLILNKRGIYAMPHFDGDVSKLQLSMYIRQSQTKYQLQVGVMDNLSDASTFVPVATINNTTTESVLSTVSFENYSGTGHYIAFRNILASGNTGDYSCNYIDDLTLSVNSSTCVISASTLPYTDNFDSYTTATTAKTGIEPPCWTLVLQDVTMTDDYKPMVYYSSSNAHSDSYSLILNKRGIYAMPAVDTSVNVLQLSFYLKQTQTKYQLQVGILNSLSDPDSFTPVATINNSTTDIEQVTVDFSSYTGTGHYIAFRNILASGNTGDYSCNYIDDLTLEIRPIHCTGINVADLPYTDNFDSYTTSTTAKTGVQPPCWTLAHQDVNMTDAYKPMIYYD
ncbi:MAG: fibronectin type III domain-containing protein, partial [Bacteroidales bacterium]|nr:fibronectin type III domain-containing protein [Bacteroidales bacterium]